MKARMLKCLKPVWCVLIYVCLFKMDGHSYMTALAVFILTLYRMVLPQSAESYKEVSNIR